MTGLDLFVIVTIFLSAIFGFARGITKEVLSLISWIGAIIISYIGMPVSKVLTSQYITNPMLADIASIGAVFILFLIVFSVISHFLSGMVKKSLLGGVDSSLGFAFGVIRGIALIFILEIVFSLFVLRNNYPPFISESRFADFIYKGSDILFDMLPNEAKGWIINQQQQKLKDKVKSPQDLTQTIIDVQEKLQKVDSEIVINESKEVKNIGNKQVKKVQSVEELASLKPKLQVVKKNPASNKEVESVKYSNKQNIKMERLLDEADDD
jgi:uncharacterized membrane protein required for colicin V production